jgi:hypothetical protein
MPKLPIGFGRLIRNLCLRALENHDRIFRFLGKIVNKSNVDTTHLQNQPGIAAGN